MESVVFGHEMGEDREPAQAAELLRSPAPSLPSTSVVAALKVHRGSIHRAFGTTLKPNSDGPINSIIRTCTPTIHICGSPALAHAVTRLNMPLDSPPMRSRTF